MASVWLDVRIFHVKATDLLCQSLKFYLIFGYNYCTKKNPITTEDQSMSLSTFRNKIFKKMFCLRRAVLPYAVNVVYICWPNITHIKPFLRAYKEYI